MIKEAINTSWNMGNSSWIQDCIFSYYEGSQIWENAQGGLASPSLKIFKTQVDKALSNLM